jgi:drug/metabolite transporter (DMT)-like permease
MTFFLFNSAVKLISLSKLAFLQNTSPIFAALIAFLFLGEIITKFECVGMAVCIIGVIILIQPYGESEAEQTNNYLGSILVLVNSFLNAVNYALLRMMKEIHYAIAPFYYGIFGTSVAMIFIMIQVAQTIGEPSRFQFNDYLLFFLIGATSALGALFKSLAFHYEKVTTLSLLKYSNLIYSLLADVILFHS